MINVNAVNKRNETALILACESAQTESAKLLLQKGSNPNISDTDGDTSLHAAVHGNCTSNILQEIITHEVLLDAQNIYGRTALWLACSYRQQDSVKILLEAGSNPNTSDDDGDTCLHAAVIGNCNKKIIHKIIDHGANVNATNKDNNTALMIACANKNEGAINVLLNANADPNIADDLNSDTSLHKAVKGPGDCSKEVLQAIIDHGVELNATNKANDTALMIACWKKNEGAINVLLNARADSNIADKADGDTCLHNAVKGPGYCSKEVLQTIIDYGVDVNATNKDNRTALMIACVSKNEGAINVLLKAHADPNIADEAYGDTCLHDAVKGPGHCSKEVLQAIHDYGVDVNVTNKNNYTALMIACRNKYEGAINVLLNAHADPNIADEADRNTCLHYTVTEDCSIKVLQAIIAHGVDLNATNKDSNTALMIACAKKNEGAINVLLNASANPNIADDQYGDTSLHKAVDGPGDCSKEVLQAIINHGVDLNTTNKEHHTALMIACYNKHEGAINVLLNAHADPNIADEVCGNTCLHDAVRSNCSIEVLQAIIDHGANVNATNKRNETALTIVCVNKNEDVINALLNGNADPNITDDDGETFLHKAVREDCTKGMLQAIIQHGADVNATNKDKVTALMIACMRGNMDAIYELLNAGADTNVSDKDSRTWLHYAVYGDCDKEVLQTIISHGADVNATRNGNVTALMIACWRGNIDAINELLNVGADPNIADKYSCTWLHYAVYGDCDKEVLQTIISHGADVNATRNGNVTALMIACRRGNIDGINELLNVGADPNIADKYSCTWLHYAVYGHCDKQVLRTIISHGANVNATNNGNVTALMIACVEGNEDAINVLLKAGIDPNIQDDAGDTCLHITTEGQFSIRDYQSFIDDSTDVCVTNIVNQSALVLLCDKPGVFAVSVLLKSLPDPNIAHTNGDTLLYDPIHNHISKELLQTITGLGFELHALKYESAAAKLFTHHSNHWESMKAILRSGADTTIANVFGDTCIHRILYREYLSLEYDHEALQMLLDHGAPVNAMNKNHQTAYMLACHQGNIDAMCALVNAGADPNIADSWGNTGLHLVVQGGSSKHVLKEIITHGADVNAVNNEGTTALMLACETGQRGVVNVLLRTEADTSIFDAHGDTCLHKLLHREYDQETLQILIDHGVPVDARNENHQTAYMLAFDQGNIDAMCAVLNAGADPSITHNKGDANRQYINDGCSSNMSLQTVMQWLSPTRQYLDVPDLEITESLSFNLASRIICNMMIHAVCATKSTQ